MLESGLVTLPPSQSAAVGVPPSSTWAGVEGATDVTLDVAEAIIEKATAGEGGSLPALLPVHMDAGTFSAVVLEIGKRRCVCEVQRCTNSKEHKPR